MLVVAAHGAVGVPHPGLVSAGILKPSLLYLLLSQILSDSLDHANHSEKSFLMPHSLIIKQIFVVSIICRYIPVMYREAAWNKTKLLSSYSLPSSEEIEDTQYVDSKTAMMALEKLKYWEQKDGWKSLFGKGGPWREIWMKGRRQTHGSPGDTYCR